MNSELFRAVFDYGRRAAGEDARFEPGLVREPDAQAVPGMKSLGLVEASARVNEVIDSPVCQDPVHIHQEQFDFSCSGADLRGDQVDPFFGKSGKWLVASGKPKDTAVGPRLPLIACHLPLATNHCF